MMEQQKYFPGWEEFPLLKADRTTTVRARQCVYAMLIDAVGGAPTLSGNRDGSAMLFGVSSRHPVDLQKWKRWQDALAGLPPSQCVVMLAAVDAHASALIQRLPQVPRSMLGFLKELQAALGGQLTVIEAASPPKILSPAEEAVEGWRVLWGMLVEAFGGKPTKSGLRDGGAVLGGVGCQHYDDVPSWVGWWDALQLLSSAQQLAVSEAVERLLHDLMEKLPSVPEALAKRIRFLKQSRR